MFAGALLFRGCLAITLLLVTGVVAAPVPLPGSNRRQVAVKEYHNKRIAWTVFGNGVTACGINRDKELDTKWTVGVNSSFGSDVCGKKIEIKAKGTTLTGTIVDLSEGADEGINLSKTFFAKWFPIDKGVFQGDYKIL